jgi:tetratricopeptide (TPR) repeat protein
MGMVYYTMEEYDAARSHLERSIEIDPTYASGQGQLGWVFYVQRQYDKAQPYFERAVGLEKDPLKNAAYRHALGWIHVNMRRYDRAREEFTRALELNPELEGAREGLQVLSQQQGNPGQ